LAITVLFRVVDIMILPFAERWGEAFLHKALGFVLVLAYLWVVGQRVAAIGLHGRQVGKAIFIGSVGTALIYLLGFTLQWFVSRAAGKQPALVVMAIDSMTGLAKPGLSFALWLLFANLVNASMEEGLFRGIMLTHFRVRLSPWQANVLQGVIFGLWHIFWPIRHLLAGRMDPGATLSLALTSVFAATLSGLAWGYLFLKTDNLWGAWLGHAINNSVLNLVHVRTIDGLDTDTLALNLVMVVGFVAMLFWTRLWAKRLQMPELAPWGTKSQNQ
jgi:membrane protease YdiL (CAAX protease family)